MAVAHRELGLRVHAHDFAQLRPDHVDQSRLRQLRPVRRARAPDHRAQQDRTLGRPVGEHVGIHDGAEDSALFPRGDQEAESVQVIAEVALPVTEADHRQRRVVDVAQVRGHFRRQVAEHFRLGVGR